MKNSLNLHSQGKTNFPYSKTDDKKIENQKIGNTGQIISFKMVGKIYHKNTIIFFNLKVPV